MYEILIIVQINHKKKNSFINNNNFQTFPVIHPNSILHHLVHLWNNDQTVSEICYFNIKEKTNACQLDLCHVSASQNVITSHNTN